MTRQAEQVLTTRALNRALLARQLLLSRSRLPLVRALEQVAGIQAQYAPSTYIGLWSRVEGFTHASLDRALERRRAIQGTLMRSTIHVVSAGDFWPFARGTQEARRRGWRTHLKRADVDMEAVAARLRAELGEATRHRDELLPRIRELDPTGGTLVWNAAAAWVDLVRVPPSGTWTRRRADLYASAEAWVTPVAVDEDAARERLLARYLQGFGPARLADAASWSGLAPSELRPVAERLRLRRFRDEEGKELLDLPSGELPPEDAPAPPRFLPTWDATLLVHARRTQILPERFRPLVFSTKTPQSVATFLVGGSVAGTWRWERAKEKATLFLAPFEPLPRAEARAAEEEAERLVRFVEPDAASYAVRIVR